MFQKLIRMVLSDCIHLLVTEAYMYGETSQNLMWLPQKTDTD